MSAEDWLLPVACDPWMAQVGPLRTVDPLWQRTLNAFAAGTIALLDLRVAGLA
ncbi:hypothetical protein [Variovorax sp. J31P207]|uniref:hypothetical protein n=1 Tax=Variovorax sp. J31P207 TaxID=3053510 RepID=UPI002578E2AC|nr:hypothetical protein [Variovorax sp. J31P207]MDM0067259.1 hypothetical protein [Variovorax sp. J31P207]